MKGLLLYEILKIKRAYGKNLVLVGVLYAVLTFALRTEFMLYMLVWMTGFYAVGSMALDEGWTRFVRALPVSGQKLAGAKFLSTGLMVLMGAVYALAMGGVVCWQMGGSYADYCQVVLLVTLLTAITMAVMLPCALKWGVERARNTLLLVFAALFGGGLLAAKSMNLEMQIAWLEGHLSIALYAVAAIAAIACLLGGLAMVRIYATKED